MLRAVWCLLYAACCVMPAVCCVLCGACCMLRAVLSWLFSWVQEPDLMVARPTPWSQSSDLTLGSQEVLISLLARRKPPLAPPGRPVCLVLGSEGCGLSQQALAAATPVTIPSPGDMESLNVGVAGERLALFVPLPGCDAALSASQSFKSVRL
jgi:SpoU rRNA Methylase family